MVPSKSVGFTLPPADFNQRQLLIKKLAGPFYRLVQIKYAVNGGILYFGKNASERFDDPDKKYGVCYFGNDEYAAFIETCGQWRSRTFDKEFLNSFAIATISCSRPLNLVDISGAGAAWIGAAGEITAGDHALSQLWSQACYGHPENVDGIYYRCRHDLERYSAALFERAQATLQVSTYVPLMSAPYSSMLSQLLDYYNFAQLPS